MWSVPNIVSSKSRTVQYRVPICPGQYRNVQYRVPRCPSQYRNLQVPSCPGTDMSRILFIEPINTRFLRFHVIHKHSLNIRKETCFLFLYDLIIKIVKNHGRSGKLWTIKIILSTSNVCDLVSSTVRKFIHSICCKMYMYEFHFREIGNIFVSIHR